MATSPLPAATLAQRQHRSPLYSSSPSFPISSSALGRSSSSSSLSTTPTRQDVVITIPSNRSFADTQAALAAAIPTLDLTWKTYLAEGDYPAALAALQALPPLNNFVVPPRDFGALLPLLLVAANGTTNAAAAESCGQAYDLDVALHVPVRLLLRSSPVAIADGGMPFFEFSSPVATLGQFGIPQVDKVAAELERNLTESLVAVAGWETYGQWESIATDA
ncbi:hypothetical protein BX600DRAFT_430437 [Xylariales sp. PMI_506]|nr:hypothetical protein BX600DRAFT_430437 [Xylariales sp. PMI_506]